MSREKLRFLPNGTLDTKGKRQLKRCPFCDGEAKLIIYGEFSGLSPDLFCTKCPARMSCREDDTQSIKKLIKAWNRRPK